MTNVQVYNSEMGIPLVRLSGPADEGSGADLADKVMREIHYATENPAEFPHPMSLRAACTRAPETWVEDSTAG